MISELSHKYTVKILCNISGVSRSGYYKWIKRQKTITTKDLEDNKIKEIIKKIYKDYNGRYGYRRITTVFKNDFKININHKRVYRFMKVLGLKSKIRKKKKYFGNKKDIIESPNILNRNFKAEKPNQKWVTDITYLKFNNKTLYLSTILDLFNNEIVSYQITSNNDIELVMNTVNDAINKRKLSQTILHSDQGHQYTSKYYNSELSKCDIKLSMSRKGNCLDNAAMESFFSHLKCELMYINDFKTESEVIDSISDYIYFYNYKRCFIVKSN
ncbi:IS3 family transposase [Orenia marismortui]|uniref:IS3 family transposase n=1 Tax=Orenia marismortui TaxID=46469 RepID=UPI0012F77B48|nr:IS3 family transposase [Orenia marismortui]